MKKIISAISFIIIISMCVLCLASCGGVSGKWEDESGEEFEFRGGKMYVDGEEVADYTVKGDVLTMSAGSYSMDFAFKISGKTMTLYDTTTFTKTESEYEDPKDKSKIAGAWEDEDGEVYTFANGTMYDDYGYEEGTYEIKGDKLIITTTSYYYGTSSDEYTFKISGNTLTLTEVSQVLTKVGSSSSGIADEEGEWGWGDF